MSVNLELSKALTSQRCFTWLYMKTRASHLGRSLTERAPGLWIFIMFGRVFDQVQFFVRVIYILCNTHNKDSPSKVGWPCSHACSWWFFFGWMIFLTDSRFYHAMGFITIWESIFLVHFFQPPKKQIEVSTGWRGRIFGFGGGLARSEYIHWHIDWFELFVLFSHYWFEVVELHGGL